MEHEINNKPDQIANTPVKNNKTQFEMVYKKTRKLTFRVRAVRVLKEHDNIADSTQSSKSNSEGKGVKLIAKYCVIKSNDNRITLRKVVEKHTVYDLILQRKKRHAGAYEHMDGKKNYAPSMAKKDRASMRFGTYNVHVTRPEILLEVLTETILHSASQHRALLSAVNGINKETKYEVILMGDFNFQVSQSKFDFSQISLDDNQSGPVTSEMIRDVPLPHGHTTKYADKFVEEMENTNLLLLTGLVGKAETSHEGIGRTSLLDYVFCSPQLLNYASNYFTWPRYMIPFSDHNLITIDFKLPNSYFQSAKQAVGPQLKFERKRKMDISPVAHSFPVVPAYLMNAPVDDLLTFFYDTYCPIIDTLAKKNTRKTTMKHPGFIHDYEIKQLKIKKNKLLRNLQNTATLQDRQTIKDKLKVINKTIQKRVKYAKNERQKKDLLQVNADMKRNPKKAWSILKRFLNKESSSPMQLGGENGMVVKGNGVAELFAKQY
eukprot:g5344.t1